MSAMVPVGLDEPTPSPTSPRVSRQGAWRLHVARRPHRRAARAAPARALDAVDRRARRVVRGGRRADAAASRRAPQRRSALDTGSAGPLLFGAVTFLVLGLGLLVTPTLTSTAINGDRNAGTLATLQVTLLSPAEIALGKLLAAWVGRVRVPGG